MSSAHNGTLDAFTPVTTMHEPKSLRAAQLVDCVPVANVSGDRSSSSNNQDDLFTATGDTLVVLRPVSVSSILPSRSKTHESGMLVQRVDISIHSPSDAGASERAPEDDSNAAPLGRASVLLRHKHAQRHAAPTFIQYEVDLFAYACKLACRQQKDTHTSHSMHSDPASPLSATQTQLPSPSTSPPASMRDPLLHFLAQRSNGVWGPIAGVTACGSAVIDSADFQQVTLDNVPSTPHADQRMLSPPHTHTRTFSS